MSFLQTVRNAWRDFTKPAPRDLASCVSPNSKLLRPAEPVKSPYVSGIITPEMTRRVVEYMKRENAKLERIFAVGGEAALTEYMNKNRRGR